MHPLDYLHHAGPAERALIGVNRATWSRWQRGLSRVPRSVAVLLQIIVGGELPHAGKDWEGWRFSQGKLWDPSGTWHSPGSILAWHWIGQELQAMRAAENTEQPEALPANVHSLATYRRGHRLTAELYRRLNSSGE